MSTLGAVITIMAFGFVIGALARFAVPGPDPMPAWLTIAIGLVGSGVGGAIGGTLTHRNAYGISVASFFVAVLLVVAYRKFVQKRAVAGPEALRFPKRGLGVAQYRQRLQRAGIDPDALYDRAAEARRRHDDHEHRQDDEDDEPGDGPPPPRS
jgi:uncharacterized membrane protein YeaQ/YmgE (transglycosylase-associated protein family)